MTDIIIIIYHRISRSSIKY